MGNTAPKGYLACDGATYNITDYQKLADFFTEQFGKNNYFGGDGTTTFAVPNLVSRFLKGSKTAGTNEAAGLPNITGLIKETWANSGLSNGAFRKTSEYGFHYNPSGSSGTTTGEVSFNASWSNSIYGKSTTVTPLNTSVLYAIKY